MTKAFDKIMAGLDDARAYLKGDRTGHSPCMRSNVPPE